MVLMWQNYNMIIMILWSGLTHYILHTLFLLSSLTQIIPRLHIAHFMQSWSYLHIMLVKTITVLLHTSFELVTIFYNCWLGIILKILEKLVSSINSLHKVQQLSATNAFAHNNLLELCYNVTMSEPHCIIVNELPKQQHGSLSHSWSCFSEFNPTVYTSGWSMPLGFLLCDKKPGFCLSW